MSRLVLRSVDVFDEHADALRVAALALSDDIDEATQTLDELVREAEHELDEAQSLLDDLQDDLSQALEGEEPDYLRVSYLLDSIERQQRKVQRAIERLSVAREERHEASRRFEAVRSDFDSLLAQAQGELAGAKANVEIFLGIELTENTVLHIAAQPAMSLPVAMQAVVSASENLLPALAGGLRWIPLSDLDWDDVPADLPFKNAERVRMETMLRTFMSEVVPMLSADPTLTEHSLVATDRVLGIEQNGLVSPDSLAFAWRCMVGGDDPIVLSAPHISTNDRFGWTNGRHRAILARSLGWTHIPARITGEDR